MSVFKKGKKANASGRPKGSGNKVLRAFRELITEKISLDDIIKDLEKCSARDRVQFKIRLLEFAQPRMRSIEISDMPLLSELLAMTPEERKSRLLELMKQQRHG
ncbi:MAG: hypothetical protein ABIS36_25905 [Chryseolinea sp.]